MRAADTLQNDGWKEFLPPPIWPVERCSIRSWSIRGGTGYEDVELTRTWRRQNLHNADIASLNGDGRQVREKHDAGRIDTCRFCLGGARIALAARSKRALSRGERDRPGSATGSDFDVEYRRG